ncbi:MAG: hypothetical protein HUK22_00915 [Thermoguttaceae bacterium]|nr:hypothetical protein [Thermoguttaceae bacterium]
MKSNHNDHNRQNAQSDAQKNAGAGGEFARAAEETNRMESVMALLALGADPEVAAKYCEMNFDELNEALKDPETLAKFRRASHYVEVYCLQTLKKAGETPRHWRAAQWLLEHVYGDRYAAVKPGCVPAKKVETLFQFVADSLEKEIDDPAIVAKIKDVFARGLELL